MTNPPSHSLVWIGPPDRETIRAAQEQRVAVLNCASVADALIALVDETTLPPDVIVLAVARPGEITAAQVEQLRERAPLARFVGWLGSWCEGETRSGRPWPAVVRTYWHHGACRLIPELTRLDAGQCPALGLPVTVQEEEWLEFLVRGATAGDGDVIHIRSADRDSREWLRDACAALGCQPRLWRAEAPPVEPTGKLLVEGDSLDESLLRDIRAWRAANRDSEIIVLLNFPRQEDVEAAQAAGANHVLAKPVLLTDLVAAMTITRSRFEPSAVALTASARSDPEVGGSVCEAP